MSSSTEFDQRRAWLDELLAKRHLWPAQVLQAKALAEELGVRVVIVDRALENWPASRWIPRTEV